MHHSVTRPNPHLLAIVPSRPLAVEEVAMAKYSRGAP
jgi:hypothetical protein